MECPPSPPRSRRRRRRPLAKFGLQDCFINVSRFPRPLLQPFLGTTRPREPARKPARPSALPPPVPGTTSPITLRFNSLYHYLRAQKVNATLITMFNSSAPLSVSRYRPLPALPSARPTRTRPPVLAHSVSRTLRAFPSETYSSGNGICPRTNCSERTVSMRNASETTRTAASTSRRERVYRRKVVEARGRLFSNSGETLCAVFNNLFFYGNMY